jgi:hypothetical protein
MSRFHAFAAGLRRLGVAGGFGGAVAASLAVGAVASASRMFVPASSSDRLSAAPRFRLEGVPLTPDIPAYERYADSIRRLPDFASCAADGQAGPIVHWDRLRSTQDVEVCLFQVFSRLGHADGIAAWLTRNGFHGVATSRMTIGCRAGAPEAMECLRIEAHWRTSEDGGRFGGLLRRLGQRTLGHPLHVGVTLDSARNEILGVVATFTVL